MHLEQDKNSFELTILGASGGPLNRSTQSFLLKRAGSLEQGYICIDAGAGLAEIVEMLHDVHKDEEQLVSSFYQSEAEDIHKFFADDLTRTFGFKTVSTKFTKENCGCSIMTQGLNLFHEIKEYYITHPHIDHLFALLINSPAFFMKEDSEKLVYGTSETINVIKEHIFNDKVWPDFTSNGKIVLRKLTVNQSIRSSLIPDLEIIPFTVSHGIGIAATEPYMSTVFLFRSREKNDHVLICGDLESDEISRSSKLLQVWEYLGSKVPLKTLKAIVIECSNTENIGDGELFGHMCPRHIINELTQLKKCYNRTQLDGLHVIITHVKDTTAIEDPRLTILRQLREQSQRMKLGNVNFSMAVKGFTLTL